MQRLAVSQLDITAASHSLVESIGELFCRVFLVLFTVNSNDNRRLGFLLTRGNVRNDGEILARTLLY